MTLLPTSPDDSPLAALQILIADDEPIIVSALEKFFSGRGHAVRTAADAETAIVLAGAHRFDAALVDARMPGDGLTVVQHFERDPTFRGRLVLMTGALATDPSVQVGPDVIRMQKPFTLKQLAPVVEGERAG